MSCIKSTGDKIGIGWVIYQLGDPVTPVVHSEDMPAQALYCRRGTHIIIVTA